MRRTVVDARQLGLDRVMIGPLREAETAVGGGEVDVSRGQVLIEKKAAAIDRPAVIEGDRLLVLANGGAGASQVVVEDAGIQVRGGIARIQLPG